jgi:uncharacterized protein
VRTVFDVNVLIRASLGSRRINALFQACLQTHCVILTNPLLVNEFAETARKPRLSGRVDWEAYNDVLSLLASAGEEVWITQPFPECRDQDDSYLLGMALSGRADYLVSSDQDLLCMETIGSCRIVTPEEFAIVLGL